MPRIEVHLTRGSIWQSLGRMQSHTFGRTACLIAALAALCTLGLGGDRLRAQSDVKVIAAGFHQLFLHDACTGEYPPQPDTCIHKQLLEKSFTFGGPKGTVHQVHLRIRGLFEPTTITGGETPYPDRPFFQVGGTIRAREWSAWHIEVSEPKQTYWLNHYPKVSHTIYNQDFEATIPVAGGANVVVRVVDGNDRQMDNNEPGLADRMQLIKGVTDKVMDGQMLRIDVISVMLK
jgi:hypothetical protein